MDGLQFMSRSFFVAKNIKYFEVLIILGQDTLITFLHRKKIHKHYRATNSFAERCIWHFIHCVCNASAVSENQLVLQTKWYLNLSLGKFSFLKRGVSILFTEY